MGFHLCEYCEAKTVAEQGPKASNRFSNMSSGDVTLSFANDRAWVMPDMILHYVADHGWQPPQSFVDDVRGQALMDGKRRQTRSSVDPAPVGYLAGYYFKGSVPDGFVEKLQALMAMAESAGNRMQTKGFDLNNLR